MNPNQVYLFEEHSSTLPIWWAEKTVPKTAVYLDAHLDLQKTSADSLAQLKQCQTLEEFRDLEAPHHLNPAARFAYGIENFLYAACELKLIDRLIWVAPAHIPRNYSSALLDYMQQMDGISFAELTSFKSVGKNALRGNLLGLDITICDFDELASLEIAPDYYLDVDIDYFVDVPADQLWVDPSKVMSSIEEQLGSPAIATISRAVGSGFMPIAFRFVGDLIHSQLSSNEGQNKYYRQVYTAIEHLSANRIDQGQALCQAIIDQEPNLAPAYYLLGISSSDAQEKSAYLSKAAQADEHYAFDLSREAIGLLHRKKAVQAQTIKQLVDSLERLDLKAQDKQYAEVSLAQVLAASGHLKPAQQLLDRQSGDLNQHEDVALAIAAGQLSQREKNPQTKTSLLNIATGSKNATAALLYLGDLEFSEGNFSAALAHYEAVHARASAWMLPLERLKSCYEKLAMSEQEDETLEIIEQRSAVLNKLMSN